MSNQDYLRPLNPKVKVPDIAVFDIETTPELDRAYLLGFYDGTAYRVFESVPGLPGGGSLPEHPEAEGSCIDRFMQYLLSDRRYCDHWIYAHNGGSFDFLYLVRWLMEHPRYAFNIIPLQSSILCLEVRDTKGPASKQLKWRFLDSYRLMNSSLEKLGQALVGEGKVKDVNYATLHLDPRRYDYLEQDVKLLYNCLGKFYGLIMDAGGEVGMTAPASAMKSFRRMHLTSWIPINRHWPRCEGDESCPALLDTEAKRSSCLHEFVSQGYYGGRVERYRDRFLGTAIRPTINYYDVNSMYPWAMLGGVPAELAWATSGKVDLARCHSQWNGFVECTVNVPDDCYLPPLPFRADGKLLFPVGTFRGVWSSEELMLLKKVGGRIVDYGQSAWFRPRAVFAEYVNHWYGYRDKSAPSYNQAMDMVAKLFLNSLYGKMGMNESRQTVWFWPSDADFKTHTLRPLADASMGAYIEETKTAPSYVIPHIAAWVTARARARLWTMMHDIVRHGGKIWYCDTDAIITDAEMPSSTKLGDLKLECRISRAVFAAPKLYFIEKAEGKSYVRAKGFTGGFGAGLTEQEFFRIIDDRGKIQLHRMRKFREGLRSGKRFPEMAHMEKGVREGILDEKRTSLPDGNTKPLVI